MFKKTSFLLVVLLTVLVLAVIPGCDGEEDYTMGSDQEFQQAMEVAVENVLRGEKTESDVLNELSDQFSGRYTESEIQEYFAVKTNNEEEYLTRVVDGIKHQTTELENQAMDYFDQLEDLVDQSTMQEIENEVGETSARIEELSEKLDATEDLYLKRDLLEEKEALYYEMVFMLDNMVQMAQENGFPDDPADEPAEQPAEQPAEEPVADPVVQDMQNYFQRMEPIIDQEANIINSFQSATGDDYTDDEALHNELVENILPATESLLADLRSISPETSEIQQAHGHLVQGWESHLDGFRLMAEALEEQDEGTMEQGNQKLDEASQHLEQFNQTLQQVAQDHGIELN